MRIYAVILNSGEPQYQDCFESVSFQKQPAMLTTISHVPKKEAHDLMFEKFMCSDCDILVHLGADMVLSNDSVFTYISAMLTDNPYLQQFSIAVQDYYSDQLIWGLNSYRNIKWEPSEDAVFTDYVEVEASKIAMAFGKPYAPAAYHCYKPGQFQSFHAGAHKAVKLMESVKRCDQARVEYHKDILQKTHKAFKKFNDPFRHLYIQGCDYGLSNKLTIEDLDYTNPMLKEVFDYNFMLEEVA